MRSLVVSNRLPIQPGRDFNGGAQRFSMFMRVLARLSSAITLVHFVPDYLIGELPDTPTLCRLQAERWGVDVTVDVIPIHSPPKTRWSYYGAGILSVHGIPQWQPVSGPDEVRAVQRHFATDPDLVFAHRLAGMCPIIRGRLRHPRLIFDLDDIEHRVSFRTNLRPPYWLGKAFHAAQLPALMLGERRAAASAQVTFVCSEADKRHLARLHIARDVVVVPNAVRLAERQQAVVAEPTVLFLGGYTYQPNAIAAERLVQRVWPLVRQRRPDARLLIAGSEPELLPSWRNPPAGVDYTGFVADLAALYGRARIVCCPINVGGGTRLKLIEAAGYGKPMISTRIGAEGLDFRSGIDILIEDDDRRLAEACLRLLADDELCRRLGQSARDRAAELYDIARVEQQVQQAVVGVMGRQDRVLARGCR